MLFHHVSHFEPRCIIIAINGFIEETYVRSRQSMLSLDDVVVRFLGTTVGTMRLAMLPQHMCLLIPQILTGLLTLRGA